MVVFHWVKSACNGVDLLATALADYNAIDDVHAAFGQPACDKVRVETRERPSHHSVSCSPKRGVQVS